MQFITGGRGTPRGGGGREGVAHFLAWYERYDGDGFWAALEKSSGEFVGWFHLRPRADAPGDEPELGYRLRRSAWGEGLCDRGLARVGGEGVRRPRRAARVGGDDGGEHR